MNVGYVGLGVMGGALVRRLMLSRRMHVFDVRAYVKAEFEKNGAIVASDLPSLAQACDVIMICVPTSADVRTVVFEKSGLVEGLSAGTIIVDQTTGDPVETRSIAAKLQECGATLVDAPVSGGPRGAAAGTIAIMCGGPPEAYEQVKPLLNSISPNIVYCGTTGNGHVAKLVNNAVAACNRMITYECAAVGVKYGLSLEIEIGCRTDFVSGYFKQAAYRICDQQWRPTTNAHLGSKLQILRKQADDSTGKCSRLWPMSNSQMLDACDQWPKLQRFSSCLRNQ